MKYLFTILLILMMASTAWAMDWHDTNQVTIAWDNPTELSSGAPVPEDNTISNIIYVAPDEDKAQKVEVGETPNTEYTITLDSEGKYLVGVKSVRLDAEGNQLSESIIAWSDDPELVKTEVFGILHYFSLKPASGLSPQ